MTDPAPLAPDDLAALAATAHPVPVKRDDVILREGTDNAFLYVVRRGVLHVGRIDGQRKVMLGRLEAGSFFGEISLFDPGPATATVTAITDGELLRLDRAELERLIVAAPAAAARLLTAVLEQVAHRLRRSDARARDALVWGGLLSAKRS